MTEKVEFNVYLDGKKLDIKKGDLSADVIIKNYETITSFKITLETKKED